MATSIFFENEKHIYSFSSDESAQRVVNFFYLFIYLFIFFFFVVVVVVVVVFFNCSYRAAVCCLPYGLC